MFYSGQTELPTIRELKVFLAVAQCGSITQAAEDLSYLNPSSVAYHIHALEQKYSAELFFHKKKRMRLTEQGQILYSAAEEIFKKLSEVEAALGQARNLANLVIGGSLMSKSPFRAILGWLHDERPEIEIRTIQYWESKDVEKALLQEEIDFGILYQLSNRNSGRLQVIRFKENVLVCAPAEPVLGDGTAVAIDQLSHWNLLVPRTNADQNMIFGQVLKQLGIKFRSMEDAPSLPVARRLVSIGRGITLVPACTATAYFSEPQFQLLRVLDADLYVELLLAWSPDKVDSHYVQSLEKAIHTVLAGGAPVLPGTSLTLPR